MHSVVRPYKYVAFQLSSGMYKLLKLAPNTTVSLGKYGSFYSNQIIGRPFYFTYELLEQPSEDGHNLRVVPAAELHAEALISEGSGDADGVVEELDMETSDQQPTRTNRDIVDDNSSQTLTLDEIEELKRNSTGAGQEIIDKLLESHSSIDKKTAFSLAKYKLRKRKKYLKRFTVLPLDVNVLTAYILQGKEPQKILELRDELIALLGCWGNVHHAGNLQLENVKPNGRYLVVDDTGGLVIAAMAERMGILHPPEELDDEESENGDENENHTVDPTNQETSNATEDAMDVTETNGTTTDEKKESHKANDKDQKHTQPSTKKQNMSANENTITVIHANVQPNLSLLKFFGYDVDDPDESHPLYEHLKTVNWLHVVDPEAVNIYSERPEVIDDETLRSLKPRQRGIYYRKQARWARTRSIVDEVRAGGYDGLVVASLMEPESVLKHAVPLLGGGASAVVYSATVEPLTKLQDYYSTPRRTAYLNRKSALEKERGQLAASSETDLPSIESILASEFFLDPTLLVSGMLQTSRVRHWQVLPGRTHPFMSGRGGAEGYIFHAVRVIPATGYISAHGMARRKKRKIEGVESNTPAEEVSTPTTT